MYAHGVPASGGHDFQSGCFRIWTPYSLFLAKGLVESDTSKAQCTECIYLYSLGSTVPVRHSLKSHIEKNHKVVNVANRNNIVNPAKKAKLEESPDKILDTFPANTCCFSRTSCNIRLFGFNYLVISCKFSLILCFMHFFLKIYILYS